MPPLHATMLRCLKCGTASAFDASAYLCPSCGPGGGGVDPGILDVEYDYQSAAADFPPHESATAASGGVFRYAPLLPVESGVGVLPAGGTPLVSAPRLARRLGLKAVYLKDETRNPTRCLKDRATAVGVSMAVASGRKTMFCASAGNAAISLAGFTAHAGLACEVFVPNRASPTRLGWLKRYGARVHVSTGDYDVAFDESEREGQAHGWYSRNCAFNPFLVEGKKTVSFEIAEQLAGVPDVVIAPVGDGCTLGAAGKGFRELRAMGLTKSIPQLIGVQSEALQPMVQRFNGEPVTAPREISRAASIAVRHPRNGLRLLKEIRESQGTMLAAGDLEIEEAQRWLASEAGLVAEFTSAATLAALAQFGARESMAGRTAVLIITGGRIDEL